MEEEIRVLIGSRLREERERLRFSQQNFADLGGASMRAEQDWERGVSAPKADFLAVAAAHGVDVLYVLTGERSQSRDTGQGLAEVADTVLMLQSRGIYPDGEGGGRVTSSGLALLLDYVRESKDNRITKLTTKELQRISGFVPKDSHEWLLQPVPLTPYQEGKTSHLLLLFRSKTPVSVVWKVGPFHGKVPLRIDITSDSELPLAAVADEDDDVRWQLDLSLDGAHETLLQGNVLRANPTPIEYANEQIAKLKADMAPQSIGKKK